MARHVIEGTWEEIKRHDAELAGRWVRLSVGPRSIQGPRRSAPRPSKTEPRELHGFGLLAGIVDLEDFLRRKHEETALEDRPGR